MQSVWSDIRFGARRLLANPGFTAVAATTLALGIGATTAIYSVVDALLLRPLPFRNAGTLVQVHGVTARGFMFPSLRYDDFAAWSRQSDIFAQVEAYDPRSHVLSGIGEPRNIATAAVTGGLMSMIGARAQVGRPLQPSDAEPGRERVAVISDRLWRGALGGRPDIVGQTIQLDAGSYQVVGVMRPEFRFPYGARQVWIPLVATPPKPGAPARQRYEVIAHLKPGVTVDQAQARADIVAAAIKVERGTTTGGDVRIRPFQERRVNTPVQRALYILFAAVAVVLLIACANMANLLLVQGAGREREVAVRGALGAGRGRLVRQFLTEAMLLAMIGGAAGICLAMWGVDLLAASAPSSMTFLSANDIALETRGLVFAVVVTCATSLLFGVVPALRSSGSALEGAIKGGRGATGSPRHRRMRSAFVVCQLALSLMLLVGAGLLARTFVGLTRVAPGFAVEDLLAVDLSLPGWKYTSEPARRQFYDQVLEKVGAIPGIEAVTLAGGMPPDGGSIRFGMKFEIAGRGVVLDDPEMIMPFTEVSGDYFSLMRIPILAGRTFERIEPASPPLVIINDSMARRLFGGAHEAIGQRIRTDPKSPWEVIVGVAGDVFQFDHSKPAGTFASYYARAQQPGLGGQQTIIVRTRPGSEPPFEAIRRQIWAVDPSLPILSMATATEMYSEFFSAPRFYAALMLTFALIGVCIAAVGLYGVLAYTVAQRGREFGIRFALGATRADVMRLALAYGARLTAAGLIVGAVGSLLVTRGLESMLVGTSRLDPITYAAVAIVLMLVGMAACSVPTVRATRVDPASVLRQE